MRVEVEVQGQVGGMVDLVEVETVLILTEMHLPEQMVWVVVVVGNVEIAEEVLELVAQEL